MNRLVGGDAQIALFDLGLGLGFEVDHSIRSFFDVGLVDEPDLYLEDDLYNCWRSDDGAVPRQQCS